MSRTQPWLAALLVALASPAAAQTTLTMDGSSGVAPLIAMLSRAYVAKTPGITINFGTGLGARARIEAVNDGKIDIAVASRSLTLDELAKRGLAAHEIARTAIVFAVHSSVPLSGLTSAQICAIYRGETTNWRALGGPDLAIAARTRPDSEVDTEVARDAIACLGPLKMPDAVRIIEGGSDMARELAATDGAIGMTSSVVVEKSVGKLRALALDGVAPSEANVMAGTYRLARQVFLVVKGSAPPGVTQFLAFVRGPEGAAIIRATGAIAK